MNKVFAFSAMFWTFISLPGWLVDRFLAYGEVIGFPLYVWDSRYFPNATVFYRPVLLCAIAWWRDRAFDEIAEPR